MICGDTRMAFDNSKHDASPAVLFDVDGTLVDSNYLHVHAWQRAFVTEGVTVEAWRIHRCIGMDGSVLVKILSGDADDDVRNRLTDGHSRYYQETASMLTALPGARELLHRITGHRATSTPPNPNPKSCMSRWAGPASPPTGRCSSATRSGTPKPPGVAA
jgi:beta-phosphoglucomutase-like phosphatase (HAD superfamily)